jgi:NAD(P)-dependent dehydrogenase (short-subunit alcohol dehydrogenase family)
LARGTDGLSSLARDSAQRIEAISCDVTNDASVETAASSIAKLIGNDGLQGLVNCAGILVDGPLELTAVQDFRRQFEVNVIGTFALTRALLPLLRTGQGRVVNIGAVSARTTAPFFGPIAASKAALASLNDAMRMEFGPMGVQVALIEPAGIDTPIWATSASMQQAAHERQPASTVSRYRPAMEAMRAAFAKFGTDSPAVVTRAIADALDPSRRPSPRQLVGKGAAQMAFLALLPIRLRDRLLMSSLGLSKPMNAAFGLPSERRN